MKATAPQVKHTLSPGLLFAHWLVENGRLNEGEGPLVPFQISHKCLFEQTEISQALDSLAAVIEQARAGHYEGDCIGLLGTMQDQLTHICRAYLATLG
jgi:hypothetical protein